MNEFDDWVDSCLAPKDKRMLQDVGYGSHAGIKDKSTEVIEDRLAAAGMASHVIVEIICAVLACS